MLSLLYNINKIKKMARKAANTVKTGTTKTSSTRRTNKIDDIAPDTSKKVGADANSIIHLKSDLKCKNSTQKNLVNLMNQKEIVIAVGPAGVGKSYVMIARALELLKNSDNAYKKIIISTPAVEADEKHGFLPGNIREKMDPYISSSLDIFDKLIGKQNREKLEELELLFVQPLAYIRGKSIDNTILLMEEAQNMSPSQMKNLLTRIGENSKFVISGDLDQSDRYKDFRHSGLYDATIKHKNIDDIGFVEFNESEIVRNKIISKILANYKREEPKPIEQKMVITPKPIIKPQLILEEKGFFGKIKAFFN